MEVFISNIYFFPNISVYTEKVYLKLLRGFERFFSGTERVKKKKKKLNCVDLYSEASHHI